MNKPGRSDLMHDFVLPTLLFAALGGMTWAVRGSSGYGAVPGCIFAGVTWGAAWWFIARDPSREQSRRYASGWIVLAVTVGVGLAGAQGWMQWPYFFQGKLNTNYSKGEFEQIDKVYGFVWLFIAGMPWAGLGACMLAWCGSLRETRVWHWVTRIACGFGGAALGTYLFNAYPQFFLPLYDSLESEYRDFKTNPSLKRMVHDCGEATWHMGLYLGFLLFEIGRRDWKNVVLILTVGIVTGVGWAFMQNLAWTWAPEFWGRGSTNWWRCWESSGGISIGIAFGVAYFLVNRRMYDKERSIVASRRELAGPNFEWLFVFFGLTCLLFLFLGFRMREWGSLYFSIVILFGVAYYLKNRGTVSDETPEIEQLSGVKANTEWGAMCLAVAILVGFFLPGSLGLFLAEKISLIFPESVAEFFIYFIPKGKVIEFEMLGVIDDMPYLISMLDGMPYFVLVMDVGIAWCFFRRKTFAEEKSKNTPATGDPNLERLGLSLGLLTGLGLSIASGLKGWANIYKFYGWDEKHWLIVIWQYLGPVYLVCLIALFAWILFRPLPRNFSGNIFPHAYCTLWLVLIVQNTLAQLVTASPSNWTEMTFSIYYVLLFAITAVIVYHFHSHKAQLSP